MKKTFDVKRLTTLALLTTIALTIFVVESAIPTLVPIPGVKLGLANKNPPLTLYINSVMQRLC